MGAEYDSDIFKFIYSFDGRTLDPEATLDQLEDVAQRIVRELWEQPESKRHIGVVMVEKWEICIGVGKSDLREALEDVLKVIWNALLLLGEVPDFAVGPESKEPKLLRAVVEKLERSR